MALQVKTDQPSPAICGELPIKIDASFDDSELSLQLKDGKYHCMLDGQLYPLATTLFVRFPDKVRKLLGIGGSVMAMCYALRKLGFYAYNFMPGTLSFTIGFNDVDKMASVQPSVESGKFHEALWTKWKQIVDEHKEELGHLQNASVSEASGVSVASSENVSIGQSGGTLMQQRDHGQMAKGNITNINNPTGSTTSTRFHNTK